MKVYTPDNVAHTTGSKYLGVLVSAKYARHLNDLRRGELLTDPEVTAAPREKLTTTALEAVSRGAADFRLVQRRKPAL